MTKRESIHFAGFEARAGRKTKIEVPVAKLMSGTPVALPLLVLHGRSEGPTIWLSAAIHGDEVVGVEIIRQVTATLDPVTMVGTVIAVPVVNVHGFNTGDRYFPDRRDLNRSFPGSRRGSLASRVAHLMMTEVVSRCELGIDLHTGSDHRTNLPQIRADLDHPDTLEIAKVFSAPVIVHARLRDGSLRQAATEVGARVLVYEAGEAHRFDAHAINAGVAGIHRVISHLGIADHAVPGDTTPSQVTRRTKWARAPRSGVLHLDADLGASVSAGTQIASIYDTYGKQLSRITARSEQLVIGHTQRALVNRGDAIIHLADTIPD